MTDKLSYIDYKIGGKIIGNSIPFRFPEFTAFLEIKDKNELLAIEFLNKIRVFRDFNNNMTDEIIVEFLISSGIFRDLIFKYRNNLYFHLKMKRDMQSNEGVVESETTIAGKFVILNDISNYYSSRLKDNQSDLDKKELILVRGQIVNLFFLYGRNQFVQGIYHNKTMEEVILRNFGKFINKLNIGSNQHPFLEQYDEIWFFLEKLDNENKYKNIIIPTGTKLFNLPNYLQNYSYGIYEGGANLYITDFNSTNRSEIHIYPPYDYNRYVNEKEGSNRRRNKLLIFNPSSLRMGLGEYDYAYHTGVYYVIGALAETNHTVYNQRLNQMTGFKFTPPTNLLLRENIEIDDDDNLKIKKMNNIRNVDNSFKDYENLRYLQLDINIYRNTTRVLKYQGILLTFNVPNTNFEFIVPGMKVNYVFNDTNSENVLIMAGIVQQVESIIDLKRKTIENKIVALMAPYINEAD